MASYRDALKREMQRLASERGREATLVQAGQDAVRRKRARRIHLYNCSLQEDVLPFWADAVGGLLVAYSDINAIGKPTVPGYRLDYVDERAGGHLAGLVESAIWTLEHGGIEVRLHFEMKTIIGLEVGLEATHFSVNGFPDRFAPTVEALTTCLAGGFWKRELRGGGRSW